MKISEQQQTKHKAHNEFAYFAIESMRSSDGRNNN